MARGGGGPVERPGVAGKQIERTIWSGVLAGVGLAVFADETALYQLLHWHHFYDKSNLAVVCSPSS